MRILQIAPYFSPHIGGIESHVMELSNHLSRAGHEVAILTTNVPRSKKMERSGNIEIIRFEAPFRPLGNPIAIGLLKGLLTKKDFDIVHCHDEHAFTSNLAAMVHAMHDQRLVISCHGRLTYVTPFERFVLRIYERTLMKATLRSAEAVICLSPSDRDLLTAIGVRGDIIHIIPNAINLPQRVQLQSRASDLKVVLCVSQLLKRKGIETLVDAFLEVHRADKKAKLVVIGEGERRAELEKRVRQSGLEGAIIFRGRVSKEELERAYAGCDVFVLPSFAEGLPTVILEAMARERPVVATDIPGIRDYFRETAVLVPPGDSRKLAEAIIELLDDEKLRRMFGRKGRELVERMFTWDIVASKIIDLYEQTLGH